MDSSNSKLRRVVSLPATALVEELKSMEAYDTSRLSPPLGVDLLDSISKMCSGVGGAREFFSESWSFSKDLGVFGVGMLRVCERRVLHLQKPKHIFTSNNTTMQFDVTLSKANFSLIHDLNPQTVIQDQVRQKSKPKVPFPPTPLWPSPPASL